MTKNKLLELYQRFQSERLNTTFINNLKNLSDYEIDLILKSKYIDIIVGLMNNNNFKMLNRELKEQIINSISSAKNKIIATYTSYLINDINVLGSGLIEELVEIISKSQESYQASNALTVATNRNVLVQGKTALQLTKIVSETISAQNCFCAMQVATNENVLINGQAIILTQLVSEASTNIKSDLAASVAKNKILLEHQTVLVYTKKIVNTQTDEEAKLIYSEIRKTIKELEKKQQEYLKKQSETYIDKSNFWIIYQQNPEEAIQLLKENIKDNEEITVHTRVRKK